MTGKEATIDPDRQVGRVIQADWPCQLRPFSAGLSAGRLGWRHGHASVAAGCWARELVGSLNNTSGEEDLDIVHEQWWLCVVHKLDGCE